MDEKSLIFRSTSDFAESPFSFLKALFNDNSGSLGGNVKQDVLEAVKLDPAVLEAQVTMHSKDNAIDAADLNRRADVVTEDTKGFQALTRGNKGAYIKKQVSGTGGSVPIGAERVPTSPTPAPPTPTQSHLNGFKDMVLQQEAALLSLNPHQLEVLMKYADVLRRQRMITQRYLECAFCKNNGKPSFWYTSHALRDVRGRVRCPVLRGCRCPRCGATGDQAHTVKYCPDLLTDSQSCCSGKSSL